jgi:hypothetical protein
MVRHAGKRVLIVDKERAVADSFRDAPVAAIPTLAVLLLWCKITALQQRRLVFGVAFYEDGSFEDSCQSESP